VLTLVVPGTYERSRLGGMPYTASKGVMRMEACQVVLYQYLAQGSQEVHCFGPS
jgi:hypothetical protein